MNSLDHFRTFGWVRVSAAFSKGDAAAMCDVIWAGLAKAGIMRGDPKTWSKDRPEHLQYLKQDPAFRAIGSARSASAIAEALEDQPWEILGDWGAFFLQFPTGSEWSVPSSGWHLDGNYSGRLNPPYGVMAHAMLTDARPAAAASTSSAGRIGWFTSGSVNTYHRPALAPRSGADHSSDIPISGIFARWGIRRHGLPASTIASRKSMAYRFRSSRTRRRLET